MTPIPRRLPWHSLCVYCLANLAAKLQDEDDRAMAIELLASQGEKKSRGDRQKERKERKESKRKGTQVGCCSRGQWLEFW